jgi:hypothetical protein
MFRRLQFHPEGVAAGSQGLSAATPLEELVECVTDPGGVAETPDIEHLCDPSDPSGSSGNETP